MNSSKKELRLTRVSRPINNAALLLLATLGLPGLAQAQAAYAKPEQAADALISAVASSDPQAMAKVLGKGWPKLVSLDDITADDRYAFLEKAARSRAVNVKDGRGALVVGGDDAWTLPIPIVQAKDGQWRFDPAGANDMLAEQVIGQNERSAMQAALAYGDAQREYARADRNGDGVHEYAQKLLSSPGKRDGLIWNASLGDESPLGEAYVPAKPGTGYHGYRYKILTGQGPQAPGGARSYLIGPRMTAGFALLAWPVQYGVTGVMSFMVGSGGQVFERDLGPRTQQAASSIKLFNPDNTWKKATP